MRLREASGLGSHGEKSWDGLVLRTCHTVGEFRQVVALQKEVWGFEDLELVPVRLLVVGEKIGGHVLGAYEGETLVGFAYGLPGVRQGHAYIHSHMLGVKATHRDRGLGREMKLFQRELAMSEGFDLIEWTFDQHGKAGRGDKALRGESVRGHILSTAGRAAQRPFGGGMVAGFGARAGDAEMRQAPGNRGSGAG
jgi:ribosomal protein S18 acetylase RimI-like enzyme